MWNTVLATDAGAVAGRIEPGNRALAEAGSSRSIPLWPFVAGAAATLAVGSIFYVRSLVPSWDAGNGGADGDTSADEGFSPENAERWIIEYQNDRG